MTFVRKQLAASRARREALTEVSSARPHLESLPTHCCLAPAAPSCATEAASSQHKTADWAEKLPPLQLPKEDPELLQPAAEGWLQARASETRIFLLQQVLEAQKSQLDAAKRREQLMRSEIDEANHRVLMAKEHEVEALARVSASHIVEIGLLKRRAQVAEAEASVLRAEGAAASTRLASVTERHAAEGTVVPQIVSSLSGRDTDKEARLTHQCAQLEKHRQELLALVYELLRQTVPSDADLPAREQKSQAGCIIDAPDDAFRRLLGCARDPLRPFARAHTHLTVGRRVARRACYNAILRASERRAVELEAPVHLGVHPNVQE